MPSRLFPFGISLWLIGCGGTPKGDTADDLKLWQGEHLQTLSFGADDNSEVIKVSPSGDVAILVASKSRKVTLLDLSDHRLRTVAEVTLFPDDTSESELTHIDLAPDGSFAAITRTLPITDADGEQTDCRGELVFVSIATETFGEVLSQVTVGAMPDAVDISPDGAWAVTADEVDANDGKCTVQGVVPSISILTLTDGPQHAEVALTLRMESEADKNLREPEQVIFGEDSDRVVATLQDTHEVLSFSLSDVMAGAAPEIAKLPLRSDGAEPWPDGVVGFLDGEAQQHFMVAGEYNDTLYLLDSDGAPSTQIELNPAEFPSDLPRNLESWSLAPFRPDSLASFSFDHQVYIAASLKHSGAVGVWRVTDPDSIELTDVVKVGEHDPGGPDSESTIGTEGIAATSAGLILTANEEESSVSLVGPL